MCGRGIDQVLASPCSPAIYEDVMRSAAGYVQLAEQANGPIPRRNGSSYVWGAATWANVAVGTTGRLVT
jgi:poly-gamma-glutamate synthesis protein (capsule biosynthesis protein)